MEVRKFPHLSPGSTAENERLHELASTSVFFQALHGLAAMEYLYGGAHGDLNSRNYMIEILDKEVVLAYKIPDSTMADAWRQRVGEGRAKPRALLAPEEDALPGSWVTVFLVTRYILRFVDSGSVELPHLFDAESYKQRARYCIRTGYHSGREGRADKRVWSEHGIFPCLPLLPKVFKLEEPFDPVIESKQKDKTIAVPEGAPVQKVLEHTPQTTATCDILRIEKHWRGGWEKAMQGRLALSKYVEEHIKEAARQYEEITELTDEEREEQLKFHVQNFKKANPIGSVENEAPKRKHKRLQRERFALKLQENSEKKAFEELLQQIEAGMREELSRTPGSSEEKEAFVSRQMEKVRAEQAQALRVEKAKAIAKYYYDSGTLSARLHQAVLGRVGETGKLLGDNYSPFSYLARVLGVVEDLAPVLLPKTKDLRPLLTLDMSVAPLSLGSGVALHGFGGTVVAKACERLPVTLPLRRK